MLYIYNSTKYYYAPVEQKINQEIIMSTTVATKACSTCSYWKAKANDGECRRHAPQSIIFKVEGDLKYESSFPATKSDDWCGDYSAKS